MQLIRELYNYRELLKTNIKKDVRGKYKGAWLGIVWSFLNPLLQLLVYSIIFPHILRVQVENFTMFLVVALIPWTFFAATIAQGSFAVVSNGNLLKKVYFPREIIPISLVTSAAINFLISLIIVFGFLIFGGVGVTAYALYLPLIFIIQYILMLGIIFITSSITVYMRDLEHIITVGIMLMFYGTPILYSFDALPDGVKSILIWNPMAHIVPAYRDILFYQQAPDFNSLLIVFGAAVVTLFAGVKIFGKLQRGFAEEL